MKSIHTYNLNSLDTVVCTPDAKRDIGIISKIRGTYSFYPFSTGNYIGERELKDILQLLTVFNKRDNVVPAILKKS